MLKRFAVQPAVEALPEEVVSEIDAPERAVSHARLGQRAVEVEQPDEAGPFAAPIRNGKNRAAMRVQAMEQVMAVLPDGFHDDERGIERDIAEDLHAALLAVDETVFFGGIVRVAAADFEAI